MTHKITRAVGRIKAGLQQMLFLGNRTSPGLRAAACTAETKAPAYVAGD